MQPFIVKAGEIATKEVSTSDSPLTFRPTDRSETVKLRARFSLLTPDGLVYRDAELYDYRLPPQNGGDSMNFKIVVGMSPATTLYHNRSVALPW